VDGEQERTVYNIAMIQEGRTRLMNHHHHRHNYQYWTYTERVPCYLPLGFGFINFASASPTAKIIDTGSGGRKLLLFTLTAAALIIEDETSRAAAVMVGFCLFAIAYSPGEGSVPFYLIC